MTGEPFVFGVDLDGVCGDYIGALGAVLAAERGVDPESLGAASSWELTEWGLDRAEFDRLHRTAVLDHRMFANMPMVEGCADALWRLSDAGVWIRIITHRLFGNWGHQVAVADTVAWLDSRGIPYRDLCFLGSKPQVEAHAYVDDGPHNVEALRATGNEVIVFDQPYNRHLAGPRATTWIEVEQLVTDLAAAHGLALQRQLPGLDDPRARIDRRRGGPATPA
jgi:5'-nucleotidase